MEFKNVFITTTDTVAGIGAPMNKEGEDSLYFLKKRSRDKKLIILVSSIEQAKKLNG